MDERKEKFVVYGAVGIDDAGSFFFYDASCDRNRDSSRRAKLNIEDPNFLSWEENLVSIQSIIRSSSLVLAIVESFYRFFLRILC